MKHGYDSVSGHLILVPTPLGNLGDITLRAIEALKTCDLVACEDTRRAGLLLKHLAIDKPMRRFDDHAGEVDADSLSRLLVSGKTICYCSDAGMPGINDPGFELVRLARSSGAMVSVLPGPSVVTLAVVGSGLPTHAFSFLGYLPVKREARRAFLSELAGRAESSVVFETPHRIEEALKDMAEIIQDREIALGRELTKLFEAWYRGTPDQVLTQLGQERRGEFVLVIAGADAKRVISRPKADVSDHSSLQGANTDQGSISSNASALDAVITATQTDPSDTIPDWAMRFLDAAREGGMTLREAVKPLARHLGMSPSELYRMATRR